MVVAWTRVQAAEVMGSGQLPETGGRWSQQGPLTEKWKQLGSFCVFGSQESLRRGTSLVVQWLRILLAVQGTQVRSPGWGTQIPHAAPTSHNESN